MRAAGGHYSTKYKKERINSEEGKFSNNKSEYGNLYSKSSSPRSRLMYLEEAEKSLKGERDEGESFTSSLPDFDILKKRTTEEPPVVDKFSKLSVMEEYSGEKRRSNSTGNLKKVRFKLDNDQVDCKKEKEPTDKQTKTSTNEVNVDMMDSSDKPLEKSTSSQVDPPNGKQDRDKEAQTKRESHEVIDNQFLNQNQDISEIKIDKQESESQDSNQRRVKVGVAGERGVVRKYLEYTVKLLSDQFPLVYRRYNDFVWLYDYLVRRYPDEAIPTLPAKRGVIGKRFEPEFVSARRKGLESFLTELINQPLFMNDAAIKVFVSVVDRDFFDISKNALMNRL